MHLTARILVVLTLVILLGCKKDNGTSSPSAPTPPDVLFLDSLIIEEMPFTDGNGAGWDLTTGPDVFFRLLQGSTTISTSNIISDIVPASLPIGWFANSPFEIDTWTTDVVVDIWDYDDVADDFIGSVVFDFETQSAQLGYIGDYTASSNSGTITVRMVVHWQ